MDECNTNACTTVPSGSATLLFRFDRRMDSFIRDNAPLSIAQLCEHGWIDSDTNVLIWLLPTLKLLLYPPIQLAAVVLVTVAAPIAETSVVLDQDAVRPWSVTWTGAPSSRSPSG